jgi:hypothetical protein
MVDRIFIVGSLSTVENREMRRKKWAEKKWEMWEK